ncbi:MAG: hypothetical protein WD208_03565 [Dehalococcoidia bacterium]
MKFEEAVARVRTLTDLRRIAGAHVVDHRQLSDEELRAAVVKVKPQYLHPETVECVLERVLYNDQSKDVRVVSRIIIVDILLDQYDFSMPFDRTEEDVIAFEQSVINASNETDLADLAGGDAASRRCRDVEMYNFVLSVAWEHHESVSPDEANLLRNLRRRLRINDWDHRILEAKLGKYPKPENASHTRADVADIRKRLQADGLLFAVRDDDNTDIDVIPVELAHVMRKILGLRIRTEAYKELLKYRRLRRKAHLIEVLERQQVPFGRYDTVDQLVQRVIWDVPVDKAIASASPRYGLNSEELSNWCRDLSLSPTGSIDDKTTRIIEHFDQLRPRLETEADEREFWYQFYEDLAWRRYDGLRSQHVIEKDLEIESKFEDATSFLFANKLNHPPLRQGGSNRPDGLLSLRSEYMMWDNKSKESPVNLQDHILQFDAYMEQADKRVPVFLVIGPAFTEDSETVAIRYHAEHFDRNIVLITADELKALAEEWNSSRNRQREEPFPLGLLAASGRYDRRRIGKLY